MEEISLVDPVLVRLDKMEEIANERAHLIIEIVKYLSIESAKARKVFIDTIQKPVPFESIHATEDWYREYVVAKEVHNTVDKLLDGVSKILNI